MSGGVSCLKKENGSTDGSCSEGDSSPPSSSTVEEILTLIGPLLLSSSGDGSRDLDLSLPGGRSSSSELEESRVSSLDLDLSRGGEVSLDLDLSRGGEESLDLDLSLTSP